MYLGGRPSMGKTALSLRLALGAAANGNGTLFISLEMRVPELTTRAMADLARIWPVARIRGHPPRQDRRLHPGGLAEARASRSTAIPLILTDPPSSTSGAWR
jgi:replicative DNA helicase